MGEPEQFKFDSNRKATIGVDFYISETHGAGVNVQIWNIAHNMINDPIRRIYFRNAQAFVYMNYPEECHETSDSGFDRYFQYVRYTLDSDIPVIRVTQPCREIY